MGYQLRRFRLAAGLSLADLALKVNYSRGYLSKVETGRAPGNVTLARRCDAILATGGALARLVLMRPTRTTGEPSRLRDLPPPLTTSVPLPPNLASGVTYMLALDAAHDGLRQVAERDMPAGKLLAEANRAVHDAGLYRAREQLLVTASKPLVTSGEMVFLRLIAVRDEVRRGARLKSREYHRAYHSYALALWSFRMALRVEFGHEPLTPDTLDRANWLDLERCADCGEDG